MAFGSGGGIGPDQLRWHGDQVGGVPFKRGQTTVAGTTTYDLWPDGCPYAYVRVLGMSGVMTGAGGAGDTVQLQDGSGNAITEAVPVNALSDKDKWDASVIDDAYHTIKKGEKLKIVTASDALSEVYVELLHINPEDTP